MSLEECRGIHVITCYECTYSETCETCHHEHEIEGVRYDCADYAMTMEQLQSMMIEGYCPVCGSYRVEVL